MPLSATVWGLSGALSKTVSVALRSPAFCGVKVTETRQGHSSFRKQEGALKTEDRLNINAAVRRLGLTTASAATEDAAQRVRVVEPR